MRADSPVSSRRAPNTTAGCSLWPWASATPRASTPRSPVPIMSTFQSSGVSDRHRSKPSKWLTGRAEPPIWFRLLGGLAVAAGTAGLAVGRGGTVGIIAAVVYGSLALSPLLAWERTNAWSKQHPLLDRLIVVPLLFLAIAYFTDLSIALCLVIGVPGGLLLAGISAVLRRRTSQR